MRLRLSYNWFFNVTIDDAEDKKKKIFDVKDFIGDMCNIMAAKVRQAVAGADFDTFHKTSAKLIRRSIFGVNEENNKINDFLELAKNNLHITNVDIQDVEPIDTKTRDSLKKKLFNKLLKLAQKRSEANAKYIAD